MIQSLYQAMRLLVVAIVGLFVVDALGANLWSNRPADPVPAVAAPAVMAPSAIPAPTLGRFVVTAHGSEFIAANNAGMTGAPR